MHDLSPEHSAPFPISGQVQKIDWVHRFESFVVGEFPDDPFVAGDFKGHCQRKVARTEFSTDDRELGRPELTPLGECGGAVELEIVS